MRKRKNVNVYNNGIRAIALAQYNLGLMYVAGQGVARNDAEAVKCFQKAAEQGDAEAQHNLGVMYANGRGVAQSYVEAVVWWRKSAEQGSVYAQYQLGQMYRKGQGVTQNYAEAASWYRKAAEQGDAIAQYSLAVMYADGEGGVAQNYVTAYTWIILAIAQTPPDSPNYSMFVKERDGVVSHLTQPQIAEAERLAQEWVKQHAR